MDTDSTICRGVAAMSAYDRILAAARWSEKRAQEYPGDFIDDAPELYALAARVASGDLDLSDMPPPEAGAGTWSSVVVWLDRAKGIDTISMALVRLGGAPITRTEVNGLVCITIPPLPA